MSKNEITLQAVSTQVKDWAPGLKDFALIDFDQQRFFKTAVLAISETPALMECMGTPAGKNSLLSAMKRAFSTGLSLNPQEGKAAIIAYNKKASYQIMKEGAIELLLNTGEVKEISVEIVYENDVFEIEKTSTGDKYTFRPARKDRKVVDGYFCSITDNDGISHIKYMTQEECFEIRDNYSSMYKNAPSASPWKNSEKGMCKKTVVKAAIRDLHIAPKAKALFASEGMAYPDDQEPPKDITPHKGTSADDVKAEIEDQTEQDVNQDSEPVDTVDPQAKF